MKLGIPLRVKIVLLLSAALAMSLAAYLYVGSQLMVEDKVSYIYDYALAEVRSAAGRADSQFEKAAETGRLIGNLYRASPDAIALVRGFYDRQAKSIGFAGAVILSATDAEHFKTELELGGARIPYVEALAQLGWTPAAFENDGLRIGEELQSNGAQGPQLPFGVRTISGDGRPLVFFAIYALDPALVTADGKSARSGAMRTPIWLLDAMGRKLLANSLGSGNAQDSPAVEPPGFAEFVKSLAMSTFDSGVRDWSAGGKDYIAAYQRLGSGKLAAVSLLSKDAAFAAARELVSRSLALGASILLLAVGITLILVRRLTSRLREMWNATQKVGDGDFTIRVDTRRMPGDEVGGLARSFNVMADRIHELVLQTAQKARMEKELETAQAVQSRFFPARPFVHPSFKLSGRYIPASECAGDWWHYGQVGAQLVVVVGDVTGHGVSAALVTAGAHSTFSLLMKQFAARPAQGIPLDVLVSSLNSAVLAAACGQATMTFVASVIDLETGEMTTANASHPPVYLMRSVDGAAPDPENMLRSFKSLITDSIPPLGEGPEIALLTSTLQLRPGDNLFWYTDGMLDMRPGDGAKLGKKTFIKLLGTQALAGNTATEQVCDGIIGETLKFFAEAGEGAERPDDITLVVASIPQTARFAARQPKTDVTAPILALRKVA